MNDIGSTKHDNGRVASLEAILTMNDEGKKYLPSSWSNSMSSLFTHLYKEIWNFWTQFIFYQIITVFCEVAEELHHGDPEVK